MTGLINSLMENYYIPPIILNRKEHAKPTKGTLPYTLVCVDGKQRLSSIRAFVKGMIPCHDHRGEKWWYCNGPSGKARKVLPEATQISFLEKDFVSFDFSNLTSEQEEDLFARVQMGMQLTPAEKMRASTGPWQELAKLYVDDFPMIVSLLKDQTRAKDFQIILACFSQIIECQHPSATNGIPGLKTNYSTLPNFLKNRAALDEDTKSHFANVFKIFNRLIELEPDVFTNVERKLKGVQTFAPIELVSIAVLISMYSDSRNNRLLLGDIQYLRNHLRETPADLRMNTTLWKFIWDYIDNLEQFRGAVEGPTIERSAIRSNAAPATTPVIEHLAPAPSLPEVKRGRQTARTKPQKALPAASAGINERVESSAYTRPHKRVRVDASLALAQVVKPESTASSPSPSFPTASSTTGSLPGPGTVSPMMADASLPTTRFGMNQYAQMSSISSSTNKMANKPKPPKSARTNVTTTEFLETLQQARASPTVNHSKDIATPSQAHQNQISGLDSYRYRAPVARMSTFAPQEAPGRSAHLSQAPVVPMMVRYQTSPLLLEHDYLQPHLASPEPFPIIRTRKTPRDHQIPRAQPKPKPRATPSPPKTVGRTHSVSQYDGTIDLTSDAEQERQDLLSSFRSRATKDQARLPGSSAQNPVAVDDSSS